jgi:hypothetical protein
LDTFSSPKLKTIDLYLVNPNPSFSSGIKPYLGYSMNLKNTAGMAEKYRRYMAGKPRVYPEFLFNFAKAFYCSRASSGI